MFYLFLGLEIVRAFVPIC